MSLLDLTPCAAWAAFEPYKLTQPVRLLGKRGGYAHDMGEAGNEMGVYDDAILICTLDGYQSFRASVDPGDYYLKNPMNPAGCAQLCEGLWWFTQGLHHGKNPCLVQDGPVAIHRLNEKGEVRSAAMGEFAIQIHSGGSSEDVGGFSAGCQVIHSSEGAWGLTWQRFFNTLSAMLAAHNQTRVPYLLIS